MWEQPRHLGRPHLRQQRPRVKGQSLPAEQNIRSNFDLHLGDHLSRVSLMRFDEGGLNTVVEIVELQKVPCPNLSASL